MTTLTPEWIKTLAIALAASFFTVCITEPVRAAIQRWVRRRELRRSLYHEMVHNYNALQGQVTMANQDPRMKSGIGERFAMSFKKSGFDLAQRDPVVYYGLGHSERYWIELLYADMEHIIKGKFTDDEQCLRAAAFTADYLLINVKSGHLSKRLLYSVSPASVREHFSKRLPEIRYVETAPPNLLDRIRRRLD